MADSTVWPKGYRCAVVLTVDYNDVHGILTQAPEVAGRDKTLSVWRYGTQRGVDRLLGLFEALGVSSSWFVPGIVAEENPGHIRAIRLAGMKLPAPVIAIRTTTTCVSPSKVPRLPKAARR